MKKITSSDTAVSSHVLAASAGVTDPLPSADPPSPPAGYVAPPKLVRGLRPMHAQVELAPRVATELAGATGFAQQLGVGAPDLGALASSLSLARAWSDKLRLATDWMKYVQQQEHIAWKHAMGLVRQLKLPFELSSERDPSIANQLPSTTAFLGESAARAKRAAAARAKTAKAKKKAAEAAPPPPTKDAPGLVVTDPVKTAAVKLLN